MDSEKLVRIDGVKWYPFQRTNMRGRLVTDVKALCPTHSMLLVPSNRDISELKNGQVTISPADGRYLYCDEGHKFTIPRIFSEEKEYIKKRLEAVNYAKMPTINLDDEAVPIAKDKLETKDNKFFVTSQLMESKRGIQLVVYAGEKGKKQKTQIFVEPEIKRLAFDQNDLNPTEVFAELRATFDDGSTSEMKAKN